MTQWVTGDTVGPTNLNAKVPSWFSSQLSTRLGIVFADDFGAVGDGVTDDTAALQLAETAKFAGATLKFTPGKTYIVGKSFTGATSSASSFLRFTTPGYWDLSGATLKFGSSSLLATGSDGGGIGVVNALANNCAIINGTIDCGLHARYGIAFKSQLDGFQLFNTKISNATDEVNNTWSAMAWAASVDVAGAAISGRAKNISGSLIRPQCPVMDPNTRAIVSHKDISAYIIGNEFNSGNASGVAITLSDSFDVITQLLSHGTDTAGLIQFPGNYQANIYMADLITHDLGCNQIEGYGVDATTSAQFHVPSGKTLWTAAHVGVGSGWYFDNAGTDTNLPNVWIDGGSGQSLGNMQMRGNIQILDGSATFPPYATLSEASLGLYRSAASTLAQSYGTFVAPLASHDTLNASSVLTVSLTSSLQVKGAGRTDGIAVRHVSVGNYEVSNQGTGQFQVQSISGPLLLTSAASQNLGVQIGASTVMSLRSLTNGAVFVDGSAVGPTIAYSSESSLGLYRSANSTLALSYGTLNLRGAALSLRTTASSASASNLTQGEICLVAVSTTSAQLAFKSGNTVYVFNAVQASP